MISERHDDCELLYDDSQEAKDRIYEIMLRYFKEGGYYSSESLGQSDWVYINAPEILGEVAEDGFRFQQKYEGDED